MIKLIIYLYLMTFKINLLFKISLIIMIISFSSSKQEEEIIEEANQENPEKQQQNVDLSSILSTTPEEKDKLLACLEIVSLKLKSDEDVIKQIIQQLNNKVSNDLISQKITGDALYKCFNKITLQQANQIFKNLVIIDADIDKSLLSMIDIDYSSYTNYLDQKSFQLLPDSQILFMKIEQVRNEYIIASKERQEKERNDFTIFGYSIKSIPKKVNIILTFIVIGGSIFGIIYLLSKVMNTDKKALKKKSKNK